MKKIHSSKKLSIRFFILLSVSCIVSACATGSMKSYKSYDPESATVSVYGFILSGQTYGDIEIPTPTCGDGQRFLVQGVLVSPAVNVGATSLDIVHLPPWAVAVPTYQKYAHGEAMVYLNVFGNGAHHESATIPAGQGTLPAGAITARAKLLGGEIASHRFGFNVHLTGKCGIPSVSP